MTDIRDRKAGSGPVDPDDFNAVVDAVTELQEGGGNGGSQSIVDYGSGVPAAGTNSVQGLTDNTPSALTGTFTITFEGVATPAINVDTTDVEDVLVMLEALPGIGAGNVALQGGPSGPFNDNGELFIEFVGDLAEQPVALLEVTGSTLLTGGNAIDPSDFVWEYDQEGSAGNPATFASTLLYVDETGNGVYVNRAYPSPTASDWAIALAAGTVTGGILGAGSVETAKIGDAQVTANKTDLPLVNPGPGLIWNDGGVWKVGT
jgi:hypothetical protein